MPNWGGMNRALQESIRRELALALQAYQAGELQSALGRVDTILQGHPTLAAAQRAKGMILMSGGAAQTALRWLGASLETEPTHADTLALVCHIYLTLQRLDEAESTARKLAQFHPKDPRALALVANVLSSKAAFLLRESHPEEAIEILQSISAFLPEHNQPHALLAQAYTDMLRFEEAEPRWALAARYGPERAVIIHARADAETAAGRFDVAEEILRQAIDEELEVANSFFLLSRAHRMTQDDAALVSQMTNLAAAGGLSPPQAAKLNYALGKSFDDLGDFERAIGHYDEANRIDYALYPTRRSFSAGESRHFTDLLIKHFSRDQVQSLTAGGLDNETPLFILGMVRSGTTLTENILSAHSQVKPGGEQVFWTHQAGAFLKWGPESLAIDYNLVWRLASDYLSLIAPREQQIRYVSDKNPTNVQLAALLHGVYPRAKMVHLERNPVDNLLSMWMTPFDESVRCASNRENLVAFFRDYRRWTGHLKGVLPSDRFKTVQYEDLTSEPGATIAGLLEYLGLPEEQACFQPEKNKRSVLTPSVYQVRQPIHRRSQMRWKNYEPWLGPFAELLGG